MKKINAGNLFAGMRSSSVIAGLFIVLIVSIVLLFANFAYLNTQSNHDKQYIGHAGELRVLSQRIAKNATEAAAGKGEAFKLLKDARNDFEKRWNILVNGDESTSLPPSPEAVKPQMDVVQQDWDGLRKNADSILASEQTVLSLHQVASTLAETIPQLQVEYEEVVDILLENGAPADQVAVAQRQSLLAERILGSVNKVLAGDENSVQAADSFGRDASLFGRVLKGMQEGNAAMSISKVTNAEAVDRLNEIAGSSPVRWTRSSRPRPTCSRSGKRRTTSSAFRRPCWTRPRNWPTASRTWPAGVASTCSPVTSSAPWPWPRSS